MKPQKLVEMLLDEESDGVFAISIVGNPAIQSDFLALSDSKILLKIEDEKKRILTGAILIPNLPILRKDEEGNDYHIFFSEETVNELSQRYLKNANQSNTTLEHQTEVEDITLVESWIKTDVNHDKSVALGIDVPVGSWIGTMKVDNEQVWNQFIEAGHVNGFSIEARMKQKQTTMSTETNETKTLLQEIKDMLSPKKEVEVAPEYVTKEEYVTLCEELEDLKSQLQKFIDAKAEVVEEVIEEEVVEAEAVVEVAEIVEEEVEMLAHTDAETEEVKLATPAFDPKLTPSQRIELAMKQSI